MIKIQEKFLFHRYTPWKDHVRCSTNIFAEKAIENGFDVTYMEKLVHPLRFIKGEKIKLFEKKAGALFFKPFTWIPYMKKGIFSHKIFAGLTYKFISNKFKAQLKENYPDFIWTVPPGSSALKDIFPKAKLIVQVVDYYPAFLGEKIKIVEKADYIKADFIFTIGVAMTDYLVNDLKIPKSKITTLGQGVDFERYQKKYNEPSELKSLSGKKLIYIGLLSKLDEEYITYLVSILDKLNLNLICIGPDVPDWLEELKIHNRVVVLGSKPSNEIPSYLQYSDIGLMLYNQKKQDIYQGQHPLKLYEYAAAGLEIISTWHKEYETLNPPCTVIKSKSDIKFFLENLVIKEDQTDLIKSFAKKHIWEEKFKECIKVISK